MKSFLTICSKLFEKLFHSIHALLIQNCLLNRNQPGFRPNDTSTSIHQLTAITHDIFTVSDANPSY